MKTIRAMAAGSSLATLLMLAAPASAAMITANYQAGYNFPGIGDVTALVKTDFDTAMACWRLAFPTAMDGINLTIDVRLANLGNDNTSGLTTYLTKDAMNGRVTSSRIDFNSNTAKWFFDPTPLINSEFMMMDKTLNQNPMTMDVANSGRLGPATLAAAVGNWDFFSVALHEIGHALGIGFNAGDPAKYTLYENEVAMDKDIDIDAVFATLYPGNKLPVLAIPITGSHFDGNAQMGVFNNTLMAAPGFTRGTRSLITDLDILGVASVYDMAARQVSLGPHALPEPSSFLMAVSAIGLLGCAWIRSRLAGPADVKPPLTETTAISA